MSSIVDQIDALEPGQIRVYRDSVKDIGFREAVIYLDDAQVGTVDFKHVFECPVKPGSHTLRAFNRVMHSKTIEFEVQPGERVTFQVANVGGFFFKVAMLLCMGIPSIRLTMEKEDTAPTERTASRHTAR
jgi:hypothetical protein